MTPRPGLADRLRGIVRSGGSAEPTGGAAAPAPRTADGGSAEPTGGAAAPALQVRRPGAAGRSGGSADPASVLGGEWRAAAGHAYLVVDRVFPPDHRHGRRRVGDGAPEGDVAWPALAVLDPSLALLASPERAQAREGGRLVFFDLETTGLAGGAGTCAFLVGCGWFERGAFHVRQLFLAGLAGERALLAEVAAIGSGSAALASYNGKTFDLPLIESRFLFHRLAPPFTGLPHLDMLHPARRLWRGDDCSLGSVEAAVLGHRRQGDVPGLEIPSRYFHYVRTGDARPLEAVFEHNRLDLLSLAMLTMHAGRLVEEGASSAAGAREALGLGGLYERAGMTGEACLCYVKASDPAAGASIAAEALRRHAILSRRAGRHDDAARGWRRMLALPSCPPRLAQEASEALAVHHEHRERDLQAARRFAAASLGWTSGRRTTALQHRLARLDRKLGGTPPASPPPSFPLL